MQESNSHIIEYSRPQSSMITSKSERNLLMMGQGGGKTATIAAIAYLFPCMLPDVVGLIAANTNQQLSHATMAEVFLQWQKFGVIEYTPDDEHGVYVVGKQPPPCFQKPRFKYKSNDNIIYWRNGAVTMLVSLENYKALEGRNIGYALLDETEATREAAVKEVIAARLRQKGIYINENAKDGEFPFTSVKGKPVNPLYIFTKPGRVSWIVDYFKLEDHRDEILSKIFSKETFFDKVYDNKHVIIASAYHNTSLQENYIASRVSDVSKEEAERLIYGNPFSKTGGEYYTAFDATTHVQKVEYKKGLPLHISFDFNSNPYMSMQVWQFVQNGNTTECRLIREYALSSPKNSIEDCCRTFLSEFEKEARTGLYVYGDASGRSSLPIKEAKNFYQIIKANLRNYLIGSSFRLLKQNPRHNSTGKGTLGRREFMNKLLRGGLDVKIMIDESCKHTILDFENVKEDMNGAKDKKKEVINGVNCEKYGHMSDAADAVLCYNFGKYVKLDSSRI